MINILQKFFKISQSGSNIKTELLAGLTSFFTMSYIFILSPKLMEAAGFEFLPSVTACALVVFICTTISAFVSDKPFIIAPFLGETAFVSYTVVAALGFPLKTALAAVFVSGILLFIITCFNIWFKLIEKIPENIKVTFCSGLGLFFIFIALSNMGIVLFSDNSNPPVPGNFASFRVLAGIFCFLLIIVLSSRKVNGAVLIAVVSTTLLGILFKDISLPEQLFSLPANPLPVFLQLDFTGVFSKSFLPVLFVIFMLVNIDTSGAVTGLLYSVDDKFKTKSDVKKIMVSNSLSVILAPLFGCTTSGTYFDSLTGMKAGGRTGLTALFCACLFLLALVFTPLIALIPAYAYSPALLYVGVIMFSMITKIDFSDLSEYAPAVFTLALMVFTYNIGIGIMSAFITYPLIKLLTGRKHETNLMIWLLFVCAVIFFVIYPY